MMVNPQPYRFKPETTDKSMSKSTIQCFFMEPTDQGERFLRRFVASKTSGPCTKKSYHDHEVVIGRVLFPDPDPEVDGTYLEGFADDDPRWPTTCSCGHVFSEEDTRQAHVSRLYKRVDTGELMRLSKAPSGAMWYADWYIVTASRKRGPDGHFLVLRTPGGDWHVDGPSSAGGYWGRSGTPPNVTATPSINITGATKYHGWLKDGKLVKC